MKKIMLFAASMAITPLFLVKEYIKTNNNYLLLAALSCYSMLIYTYTQIFREKQIGSGYVLLQGIQMILVAFIGFIIFGEAITLNKVLGILSACAGICLLS